MSLPDARSRKRSVIPRWRSFLNTPSAELVPTARFPEHPSTTSAAFRDLLKIWRASGRPEDFVDIMDAGLASGSRLLAVEGAKQLIPLGHGIKPRILERAEAVILRKPTLVSSSEIPFDENAPEEIATKIAGLKKTLRESPRNPLTHLEIARLYCRLAQFEAAMSHVRIGLSLAPNDRFTLRAATRFFTLVHETPEALRVLRQSDAIQYDPWVQSAELSAAQLINRETKFAERAAKRILAKDSVSRENSELASGWVSKVGSNGLKPRKSFQLLSKTLSDPTENALAQGIWFVESVHGQFLDRFPDVKLPPDAHEARSILLTEKGLYEEASMEAIRWFVDQPFQARAAIQLGFLSFVYTYKYDLAKATAEKALLIHPQDWQLLNLAVIANVYTGDLQRARKHLNSFSDVCGSDEQRAFLEAATGMLEFSSGSHDVAVSHYISSIRISRLAKRADLMINAAIYMVEMASRHGMIIFEDLAKFKNLIADAIVSLPPAAMRDAERTWEARKPFISSSNGDHSTGNSVPLDPTVLAENIQLEFALSNP